MSIPLNLDDLKDVGIYVYSVERNGDVEMKFSIDEPGSYKLVLTKKEIDRLQKDSEFMVKADRAGFFTD